MNRVAPKAPSPRLPGAHLLRMLTMLAAAGLLSCGPETTAPMPDIPQTVDYDTVKIDYAGEDGVEQTDSSTLTQAIVGESSELAGLTRQAVFGTNRTIYRVFELIDAITAFPPLRRGEDWWEWEGTPDGNYLFFRIDAVDDDTLEYTMRWGDSAQDNATIFTGWFRPFEAEGDPQEGVGVLRIDFDAIHAYDPSSAQGKIVIAFRARNQVRQVRVGYYQLREEPAEPLDAIYRYVELPSKRGRLVFFGRGDFAGDGRPHEFLSVQTVWLADRRGRVAARIEEGSFDQPFTVRQCWDASETVDWAHSQPTLPDYDGGSQDDCAPGLRSLDIEAPTYEPPGDEDPQVPEPHPSE
ncbi:MAG: hypothetical protein ACOC9W_06055 [Persicimonas sp.]